MAGAGVAGTGAGARGLREVVIVGASLAGLRAAETLRAEGWRGRLTIVGDERFVPYDRPPLSKELLTGALQPPDVALPLPAEVDATWLLGRAAVALDLGRRIVTLADGTELPFDGLVLATGSGARTLPLFAGAGAGAAAAGDSGAAVHTLRSIDDAMRLRGALGEGVELLVVGCGFVGVEVASSARALGARVTVVGLDPPLAPAGPLVSAHAARLMEEAGVRAHVGHGAAAAERVGAGAAAGNGEAAGDGARWRVRLSDGTEVAADQVVVAVGSYPHVGWLDGSGLELADGVVCDAALRPLGTRGVVAAGDIVRWPHPLAAGAPVRVEHWSNAVDQGEAAAQTLLAGDGPAAPFRALPSFWSNHFGTRLQSVGLPALADRFEPLAGDPADGRFAATAHRGDRLLGAVAYGMPRALLEVKRELAEAVVAA